MVLAMHTKPGVSRATMPFIDPCRNSVISHSASHRGIIRGAQRTPTGQKQGPKNNHHPHESALFHATAHVPARRNIPQKKQEKMEPNVVVVQRKGRTRARSGRMCEREQRRYERAHVPAGCPRPPWGATAKVAHGLIDNLVFVSSMTSRSKSSRRNRNETLASLLAACKQIEDNMSVPREDRSGSNYDGCYLWAGKYSGKNGPSSDATSCFVGTLGVCCRGTTQPAPAHVRSASMGCAGIRRQPRSVTCR